MPTRISRKRGDRLPLRSMDSRRRLTQSPVQCPQGDRGESRCREQVNIDQSQPTAHEPVPLDEPQQLFMVELRDGRQGLEQRQDFQAVPHVAARQFANDQGMTGGLAPPRDRKESLLRTPEPGGLFEYLVVDIQRRSHMHEYAHLMQIHQA